MENQPIPTAIKQLTRSERGTVTCKLLLDFLTTSTVDGLDCENSKAVASLIALYLLGNGFDASEVRDIAWKKLSNKILG